MKNKETVFIGLSGGVDSAVSAYLLKKEGYKVVGAFIKTWTPEWLECTWKEERRDAMRVAAHLQIPFVTIDLEKEYKENVADYMISEYKLGRTPNPDVMCNKEIKFGAFLKKAVAMGADFVATGHYAQVTDTHRHNTDSHRKLKRNLCKAEDPEKEQSYFLWTLTQDQLSKILFPIGHLKKSDVRKIAKQIKLPNAEKKDSQGICFLGDVNMKDFLSHYIKTKKGTVLNKNGEEIGTHDGAVFFTIGERHGFIITKKTTSDNPLYVVEKDLKKNTITVSEDPLLIAHNLHLKTLNLANVNWINEIPKENKIYSAQIRYHQKYQNVKLSPRSGQGEIGSWQVEFEEPQTSASGQSIVVYDKDVCLGGGVII
ncbi:MAG: tRNA 2-thiouridine(34) synthase MnmA [Candidatus Paceibacterota bacterium]